MLEALVDIDNIPITDSSYINILLMFGGICLYNILQPDVRKKVLYMYLIV